MSVSVRHGAVWNPADIYVRHAAAWHLAVPYVRHAAAWWPLNTPAASMLCVADPTTINFFDTLDPSSVFTVTTDATTVTPSGGTGPYTYAWSYVSGDTHIVALSPTADTTAFGAPTAYAELDAVWKCTVTDAGGLTAEALVSISISLTFEGP